MTYAVTVRVNALYSALVEADSIEDAKDKAESEIGDMDLGDALAVDDCYAILCEDKNGNVWTWGG